jgi:hypothetical protein
VVAVAVRPSPVWGAAAVLATLPSAGTRERVCDGVREAARTRKGSSTARVGFGRDWGIAAGNAAEPGQRHGWRRARRPRLALECACEVRFVERRACGGQRGRCSPPVRPRARPTRPRQGHGGAGHPKRGGESYARGKGAKVQPYPRDQRARELGSTMVRGRRVRGYEWLRARTRT